MNERTVGWNLENSYSDLPEVFYTCMNPIPVTAPEMVILNTPLAQDLGLDPLGLSESIEVLAGNQSPPGSRPLAQAYAGHQFGHFTLLGDGRALLLGEQITPRGERFDVQLKGSGPTPYSRGGDGRAALGPMLREYIISEAMNALGIPTTRSLAVVTTGEKVRRETLLTGAVLTRVAASHIRVGTFEYAAQWGSTSDLIALAQYTLGRHFPEGLDAANPYLYLLEAVVDRQASLIAHWQLVGFVHGVMNTDNMVLSGETIDYGPCAFMDTYDPATVFSSIDRRGRYAYGNQPKMAQWNLTRLAEALIPVLDSDQDKAVEIAQATLYEYQEKFHQHWLNGMRAKLGLQNQEAEDESLVKSLLAIMHKHKADYTNTFLDLTHSRVANLPEETGVWVEQWEARRARQDAVEESHKRMRETNPAVIPRNHRVEEVLKAANEGDLGPFTKLLEVLSHPYAHTQEQEEYADAPGPSSCRYRTFCGT